MAGEIGEAFDSEAISCGDFPFSFPSQPPDIKNWFSSYEYESPDSSDFPDSIRCLKLPQESESAIQDPFTSQDKNEDMDPSLQFVPNSEYESEKENLLLEIEPSYATGDINSQLGAVNTVTIGNGEEDASVAEPGFLKTEQLSSKCSGEEPQANASTDGFISTKKRKNTREEMKFCSRKMVTTNEDFALKQSNNTTEVGKVCVLADRTNVQAAMDILGKWQCPRKRKPYIAPPLKQLRLERWVRRAG